MTPDDDKLCERLLEREFLRQDPDGSIVSRKMNRDGRQAEARIRQLRAEVAKWRNQAAKDQAYIQNECAIRIALMREVLRKIVNCFEAARSEGLTEQLAALESEPRNIKDLVERRLLCAQIYASTALEQIQ